MWLIEGEASTKNCACEITGTLDSCDWWKNYHGYHKGLDIPWLGDHQRYIID